jgi:prepilin-type N-terminal cleavage/methylation domain-containing protein
MRRSAFTFIELLVSILIFSVIAVSVYSAFNTGIITWRKLDKAADFYQQAQVVLELMANEVASFVPSEKVPLKGAGDKITFLSRSDIDDKNKLARVEFFLDSSTNTIIRSQKNLASVLNELQQSGNSEANASLEEFAPNIKRLAFKYYCLKQNEEGKYEWVDSFDPESQSSCIAVSISVGIATGPKADNESEDKGPSFTKVVAIYAESKNAKAEG